MLKEFKAFVIRGNVIDLAVAFVMGAAFNAIVKSLVNDVIMPPIGLILGRVDFTNLFISLNGRSYDTLAAAKAAGAPTLNYGNFIQLCINFLVVAFVVFMMVRAINRLHREKPAPPPGPPTTKECPHCLSTIPIKATRCAHCTSELVG